LGKELFFYFDFAGCQVQLMKSVVIVFALAALFTGLKAAKEWHKASKIQVDLGYDYPGAPPTYRRMGREWKRTPESGEPEIQRLNEIVATWDAISESSQINKGAAQWTAVSVGASAISAIFSALFL
jgi:hypothetical protein